jgi:protoheme IX farnesyltransferase
MKNGPTATVPVSLATGRRTSSAFADYVSLTKPRLNLLVVISGAAGYYLGVTDRLTFPAIVETIVGTAFVAGSAAVLNQVYERDTDALMRRTRSRPLPGGRVAPGDARIFGLALAGAGLGLLTLTHVLAAVLALITLVCYLLIYTPMKQRSPAATLVGAVPGALPPLIGWAAATGSLSIGAWSLFAIVFLWQVPHFMAIAWMYRDDFEKAKFPLLPVIEPNGYRAGRQALIFSALLAPAGLVPTLVGMAGVWYAQLAVILGLGMLFVTARFAANRSDRTARALFYASLLYLPLVLTAMIIDH